MNDVRCPGWMRSPFRPLGTTVGVLLIGQAALAAPPGGGQVLEEIIVTATKRTERLQDVPIAVSAFSAEELRMLQAEDLAGLQGTVPNMNLVQGRGSASSANVYIRGVGQPDALQTFDLGVGQGGSFTVHHHFKKSGPRRRTISVTALDDEGTASAPQTFSIQVHK